MPALVRLIKPPNSRTPFSGPILRHIATLLVPHKHALRVAGIRNSMGSSTSGQTVEANANFGVLMNGLLQTMMFSAHEFGDRPHQVEVPTARAF